MKSRRFKNWVWYAVAAGIVTGLFVPPMIATALDAEQRVRCPIPAQGDVLGL
ncbi:MAG: hypothetical protein HUU46_13935 [Candidatus Hydrogenedentes bacterium]|nr:hypothetical protein [Candidatus Hydrogenedentota bacterium]